MALETDPIDLKIDPVTGELVVTDDLVFSTGSDAVAQGLRLRLQLFKGEWFLNLDEGVPYYEDVLGQKFDEKRIRAAFRPVILSTPGVVEIISLAVQFDGPTRDVTIAWEVRTEFGDTVADTLDLTI